MYYKEMPKLSPEEVLDYLRKSQSDDPALTVEEVLAKHESILDEWAEKHLGGKVPEHNKFREIVSGETLRERPEINKVLRLIENPKYKAVKIVEPQRLTRGDLEDIGRIMKLLKLTNTLVITPERIYDLRDEYDWNAFEAELKRGNDYLNYYKKIQKRGRLLSVAAGNYLGSIPPYGYEKTKVLDGKKKCPTLKEKPEEADVVRMIFDMYVNQGLGPRRICNHLEELKVKPPKRSYWSPETLFGMLENVHYTGKVKWNWRQTQEIVEDGVYMKTRPKAKIGEYLIYEGRHEGIIPEELFNAAQAKKGRNHKAPAKTKVRNPFASLVYCRCGRGMSYRTYKSPDGIERSPARLLCNDQAHCGTGSVLYAEFEERICEVLEQCIEDFEIRVNNNEGDSVKLHARLIKNLEKRMEELQAQELSQWELQSHPDESKRMPQHIFQKLNEKLLKEKEEVHSALCKAYESMPEPVNYEERVVRFKDALGALRDPEKDAQEKNRLLKACIDRIEYSREKPERIKSQQERVYVDGRRTTKSPLQTGANWTAPPFEIDVKLKV
jgi:hypothetical protein